MIQLFKKNDITNILILFPYVIVLRIYSLIHPTGYSVQDTDGIFSVLIFEGLLKSPISQSIVAILLIYIQANMINLLVNRSRLLSQPSALPGLVYALFTSYLIEFQGLTPSLLGMTFLILASFNVFSVYKNNKATGDIFNSALSISLASIFYLPFAIVVVPLFIEISILKSFKFKERLQFLFGFIVLYWIVGSVLFYFNKSNLLSYEHVGFAGSVQSFTAMSTGSLSTCIAILVFVLFCLFNYYNYMKKKGIEARKKIDFFYWLMLSSFACLFIFINLDQQVLLLLALPFSLFIGISLQLIKNVSLAELVHALLLIGLFVIQFGQQLSLF